MRKLFFWKLKNREITLGERTVLMGVLNVTPDSFSDGGRYQDPDRAFAHALELEEQGADILDVGAESTRPESKRISLAEELRRLIPVLKRLKDRLAIPISVDTYKAEVAERAIDLGVEIINDPSGLTFEPQLARVVSQHDAGLVLNHMRGRPETWAKLGPMPEPDRRHRPRSRSRHQPRSRRRHRAHPPGHRSRPRLRQAQGTELASLARLGELGGLDLPIMSGPSAQEFPARGPTRRPPNSPPPPP